MDDPQNSTRPQTSGEKRPSPGLIGAISFDGIDCPVCRTDVPETYFAFEPPSATPTLFTDCRATNKQLIAFVNQGLPAARDVMADMRRRYRKSPSTHCRYQTGDVAYVYGRPFMLRVYPQAMGQMHHASRGRANVGVRVVTQVSLVELFVIQTGSFEQRRGSFISWADGILVRNALGLCAQVSERAGVSLEGRYTFRARESHDRLIYIDQRGSNVWLSRDLIPFPPHCMAYAFARALADHVCADEDDPVERAQKTHQIVECGCPDWRLAHDILTDKDSVFRRQ